MTMLSFIFAVCIISPDIMSIRHIVIPGMLLVFGMQVGRRISCAMTTGHLGYTKAADEPVENAF